MSIISKETFELFTKEEKEKLKKLYNDGEGNHIEMDTIFDKSLLSTPKIKTWADIAVYHPKIWDEIHSQIEYFLLNLSFPKPLLFKLMATIQIQYLIKFGYGGEITEEEERELKTKFAVLPNKECNGFDIVDYRYGGDRCISFHTYGQAYEFLSYPENVDLFWKYYMIQQK